MGCGASSVGEGASGPPPDPAGSAEKYGAPPVEPGAADPPGDPFNDGSTREAATDPPVGLTGVAAPLQRETRPRTEPSAGGRGQTGVASSAINIEIELKGLKRPSRVYTASGPNGVNVSSSTDGGGMADGVRGLRGVSLGALHEALTAECDTAEGGAVGMEQFGRVVRRISGGSDAALSDAAVEALFKAMDTDGRGRQRTSRRVEDRPPPCVFRRRLSRATRPTRCPYCAYCARLVGD